MNDQQLAEFDRMLESGMPMEDIARELGMSFTTLKIRLLERGDEIIRVRVNKAARERLRHEREHAATSSAELIPA